MPHISKRDLDAGIRKKLFDQFFQTFKLAGQESLGFLISELFTTTEKLMFAKRLAIALLLDREIPQHVICEYLSVSPSTVARISLDLDRGRFNHLVKIKGNRKERMLDNLIKLIFFSMPPRVGRGRWKNVEHLFDH